MVAAAVIGVGSIVGAGASIASGNKAAKAIEKAGDASSALAREQAATSKAVLSGYTGAGATATPAIQALLGLGGDKASADKAFGQYRSSTGYDYRLAEGNKALTAALGRNSMLDSGAAVKSAVKYNQSEGSDEFQRYIANLQGQQNIGFAATSAQIGVGNNMVNNITANNNATASAKASAALNTGTAINGALGSLASVFGYSSGLKSSYGPGSSTFI